MFKAKLSPVLLLMLAGCVFMIVSPKCTDRPQCFKKLMFNFNFPEMDVYEIKSTTQTSNQYMMKAYGDFNNDLFSDFIAVNQQHEFLVFVWNNDLYLYEKVFTASITNQVIPKTFYLVDVSGDGRQDIVVWGYRVDENQRIIENCLVAFVRQDANSNNEDDDEIDSVNYDFKQTARLKSNPTTDPIVIGHKLGSPVEGVGFLMVLNSTRQFIRYMQLSNVEPVLQQMFFIYLSELVSWSKLIIDGDSYSSIQFLDPHWNSYVDLTGDCHPDLMIMNEKGEIEVWIGESQKFKLNKIINMNQTLNNHLVGITFSDIDYDGAIDLLIALEAELLIYRNPHSLTIDDRFCQTKNQDVTFSSTPITVSLPSGHKLKRQALHLGDINIDGYPDLFLVIVDEKNNGTEIPILYENQFKSGGSFYPFDKPNFNNGVLSTMNTTVGNILSVSFIDILQNGILDMIITYQSGGKYLTKTFYNNYLCQNDYFIKGYGLFGPSTAYASQYPGMSFYWLNSVNDGYKISYSPQIIQSAYDSLQLPYAFSGLGRTNNYVETFTIGRNGIPRQWSPIIPNSQLGVFTTHKDSEEWEIRIFSFPLYELIAVIICTAVILTVFGVYLMYRKCKGYGKKQEPLQIQFIN